jgi:hypothetical protein
MIVFVVGLDIISVVLLLVGFGGLGLVAVGFLHLVVGLVLIPGLTLQNSLQYLF